MIFDALKLIQIALQNYIREVEQPLDLSQDIVVLDNIAMAEELGGTRNSLNERIVMSLINIQEETTLKNSPHYRIENGRTVYQNPPVNLNLFVLFSVLHTDQYDTALKRLARIIEFFQWKKEFSFATTPGPTGVSREVRILPDLYTLNFDQLNHLWGSLGGKQVPFVMYRTRLVSLDAQKRQAEGEPVLEQMYQ
jgi:Pvc16 N-terminal domain